MDNKGFTLVELLAVIAIITLLTVVAVPSALVFQENMRKKMFCSKVETIERAARLYGDDVKETIKGDKIPAMKCSNITDTRPSSCQIIYVYTLLAKGLLKKEANPSQKDEDGETLYNEFLDPRNYSSMKNDYVLVYVEDNRVYSKYVYKNKADSEFCNKDDVEEKLLDSTKVFGYYYEEEHDASVPHGRVNVW